MIEDIYYEPTLCMKVTLEGDKKGSIMIEILLRSLKINGMYTHV